MTRHFPALVLSFAVASVGAAQTIVPQIQAPTVIPVPFPMPIMGGGGPYAYGGHPPAERIDRNERDESIVERMRRRREEARAIREYKNSISDDELDDFMNDD